MVTGFQIDIKIGDKVRRISGFPEGAIEDNATVAKHEFLYLFSLYSEKVSTDFDYDKYLYDGGNLFFSYLTNKAGSIQAFHAVIIINSADDIAVEKGGRWKIWYYPELDNTAAKE